MYRRDGFDLIVSKAAALLACADYLETLLLQKALCGDWFGYLPAREVLRTMPERLTAAIDVLYLRAYREGQLVDEEYLRLLARIGTPTLSESWTPSGKDEVQLWPQAEWRATRRDLLHFYVLVKAEYVDLKATLQAQPVGDEDLRQMAEWASRLLDIEMSTPAVIGDLKNDVIQSWHLTKWSPPEKGPPRVAKRPGRRTQ